MDSSEIADEAAAWVIRLDRDGDRADVRQAFEHWVAEDRRRLGAYVRAASAWSMLDRAAVLPAQPRRRRFEVSRRALVASGAVAAGTALVIGLVEMQRPRPELVRTALGEMRRVRLADGSMMVLNSASAVEVLMEPRVRRLKLVEGQAWFQVAKDPGRPFVVSSDDAEVRAVGTAFSVDRRSGEVEVLVTEGVVELSRDPDSGPPLRLHAGLRASVRGLRVVSTAEVSPSEMQRSLAWRDGQIALDDDPLSEAVEQFNRYNVRKLVIESPELADAKLVGWFWLDDPDAFATAAARAIGAEIKLRDRQIIFVAKR